MASDARTTRGVEAVDRISNLPTNLIDLIVEYLPTHDAARTSILSKPWRNIWGMHPRLHLDANFFSQLVSQKFSRLDEITKNIEVSRTISNIFIAHSHRGPILDFLLCIPKDMHFHLSINMKSWIKNISNNGVKELKLLNESLYAFTVPSHFFSCSQLTHLRLKNCSLNPPPGFGGFCNLISVELVHVQIIADMSFGTKLKDLYMDMCAGIEHLECQFKCENNLTFLSIIDSEEINRQWFEVPLSGREMITLEKLVVNMPRITSLYLDGFFLKISEPGAAISKRLTRAMENLKFLHLYSIELYDLVQIQHVLLLVRSAPNLKVLDFKLDHEIQSSDGIDLLDLTVLSDHMILDRLETLKMYNLVGSRAEFEIIKLLLASSPSLKWIELKMDTIVGDPTEELRISLEVLQISRASKSAQIQWM